MNASLVKIDELVINQHYYLGAEDECYYLSEYIVGAGFSNPTYDLILNFKQEMKYQNTSAATYKHAAIQTVANLLKQHLLPVIDLSQTTLIPVPPSTAPDDPLYDDRGYQALRLFAQTPQTDIRRLIRSINSEKSFHNGHRDIQQLEANLAMNVDLVNGVRNNIILFDDVLTTGAHFVVCKRIIHRFFPHAHVIGVFMARRYLG